MPAVPTADVQVMTTLDPVVDPEPEPEPEREPEPEPQPEPQPAAVAVAPAPGPATGVVDELSLDENESGERPEQASRVQEVAETEIEASQVAEPEMIQPEPQPETEPEQEARTFIEDDDDDDDEDELDSFACPDGYKRPWQEPADEVANSLAVDGEVTLTPTAICSHMDPKHDQWKSWKKVVTDLLRTEAPRLTERVGVLYVVPPLSKDPRHGQHAYVLMPATQDVYLYSFTSQGRRFSYISSQDQTNDALLSDVLSNITPVAEARPGSVAEARPGRV
jgi:hypothetical protein